MPKHRKVRFSFDDYMQEFANACPKCSGTGEEVIGCAVSHAITFRCSECLGSGKAQKVEQESAPAAALDGRSK